MADKTEDPGNSISLSVVNQPGPTPDDTYDEQGRPNNPGDHGEYAPTGTDLAALLAGDTPTTTGGITVTDKKPSTGGISKA